MNRILSFLAAVSLCTYLWHPALPETLSAGDLNTEAVDQAAEVAAQTPQFDLTAPSSILMEASTGTVIYEEQADQRLSPASITKIMTLILIFDALKDGTITLEEEVTTSNYAKSMGGSQVFLEEGEKQTVDTMMKCIVVASANDSCVALAEKISGSVDGFVKDMNNRAQELNMCDTNFVNCTGLPAPNQYSCAKDAAIMFSELIRHEKFFDYSKEWMFDFHHPSGRDTVLTNTNKMIRSYEGCDGGKTGFTNEAMYCLSATAKRGDMRLIGVITGAETSKVRNAEMAKLFDYGFAGWSVRQVIFKGVELDTRLEVEKSREGSAGVAPARNGYMLTERGSDKEVEYLYEFYDVELPLPAGSKIGKITASADGEVITESDLITTTELNEKTYLDILKNLLDNM